MMREQSRLGHSIRVFLRIGVWPKISERLTAIRLTDFTWVDTIPTGRYGVNMSKNTSSSAREKLVVAATLLIRKHGYASTTVDHICSEAGVTKGAFFHYFKSKEAIGESCLCQWDDFGAMLDEQTTAAIETDDPVKKATGFMDGIIALFNDPNLLKSCLAGTIAHEVTESNPALREATHKCFTNAELRFASMLHEACRGQGIELDTASLASLWIATMQGSLTLGKASGDQTVVASNLQQVKDYITVLLGVDESQLARRKRTPNVRKKRTTKS